MISKVFFNRGNFRFFSSFSQTSQCFTKGLEFEDKGIFVLTLNRGKARNALGREMVSSMKDSISYLNDNKQVRVVIVKSAVENIFCAGADLKVIFDLKEERIKMTPEEVSDFLIQLRTTFSMLENISCPSIAAIDGFALGGGLELALCCDMIVAGDKCLLGLPETSLGIIPGAGGTQRLSRLIGVGKAKELIFTARKLNAFQAKEYGIVNAISSNGYEKALEIAREILPNGPISCRVAKRVIKEGISMPLNEALSLEQSFIREYITPSADRLEGLKAFKEKRKPLYKGE